MRYFLKFVAVAVGLFCITLSAQAVKVRQATAVASTEGSWFSAQKNSTSTLDYSAKVYLLGKATTISLRFYCDTTESKDVHGALGFDLKLSDISQLTPFDFDAFEGPDAATRGKKLLRTMLYREGKLVQTLDLDPSGFIPSTGAFAFGVSAITAAPKSDPKALLQALANGADILLISVTDNANPKLKLEFPVSVTGKGEEFKKLLDGVK